MDVEKLKEELLTLQAHVQSQRELMDELNWYGNDIDLYKDQQRIKEIKKQLKELENVPVKKD